MYQQLIDIITRLETDNTLQTLLEGTTNDKKIRPSKGDNFENFPCITYEIYDGEYNTVPSNTEQSQIQFNIYSKSKKNIEDITLQVNALLNYYKQAQSGTRIIYLKRVLNTDINEPNRQLYGKVVRYEVWSRD